jgi:hypothetical protein
VVIPTQNFFKKRFEKVLTSKPAYAIITMSKGKGKSQTPERERK